jgi:1-acyl-sn-glycerol-3-phosphate acyltransferase
MRGGREQLIPATPREGFARVFTWYTRRLLRKRFHRVHATPRTLELLREMNAFAGPAVMCCTHSSWWDPLVALLFQRERMPLRQHYSPIEAEQLARFRFFRKLGLFGIDPDDPRSLAAMAEYIDELRQRNPRFTLGITPQGRFADPREPIRLRPGAAAIATRLPEVRVLVAAIEYAFWQDSRPSVFVDAIEVPAPVPASTAGWHRNISAHMQHAADELSRLVIARDAEPFAVVVGPGLGTATSVNPLHGLWLRLRGRAGEIQSRRGSSMPVDAAFTSPATPIGGGSR